MQDRRERWQGFSHKPDVPFKPNGRSNADVNLPGQYVLKNLLRLGNGELDLQAGMGADDTGDGLGDRDLASEWTCTYRKRTHFEASEERDLTPQILVTLEHRFTAFEQNAAKRRRYSTLASAIEQQHTERALQRGNAAGKARLRNIHLLGRPREVAVAAECDRETDESEIIHDTKIVSEAVV